VVFPLTKNSKHSLYTFEFGVAPLPIQLFMDRNTNRAEVSLVVLTIALEQSKGCQMTQNDTFCIMRQTFDAE